MLCWKPIGSFFKTALVTMIPTQPCFWRKTWEHDVTLTSFTADLSGPWNIPLAGVCEIYEGRGMQSLVAISPFVFFNCVKKSGGERRFGPPSMLFYTMLFSMWKKTHGNHRENLRKVKKLKKWNNLKPPTPTPPATSIPTPMLFYFIIAQYWLVINALILQYY